ncbi:hypothetical protein AAFF_G00011940 [Aldrovandia affinis]|uniref:Uncharacterized protein n=1 Tax=Aldrovandia affinis TaxID=143900 RepID=A0AAD7S6H7_9TELE|nr:hypothetical protein AAFF_G00011940 [Aldrovandia affinis]
MPHQEAPPAPPRPATLPKPKINLLLILRAGWDLSKVQARMAFSSYLHRVQMRLLAESRGNGSSAWPEKDDDQMELVTRFLKRAASNLQQDLRMVLPSRRLPLPDRHRILSHQLGEFLHCYNKETEQMVKKMETLREEQHCVNPDVFQEFVTEASESELEEVLTLYTHKNKSASVFLGTGRRRAKADDDDDGSAGSGEVAEPQNQSAVPVAAEESSASHPPLPLRAVRPTAPQPTAVYPPALDCAHIYLQHCSPPPESQGPPRPLGSAPVPPHPPPQPPAPALAPPPQAPGPAPPPRATWASSRHGSTVPPLAQTAQKPPHRARPCTQPPPATATAPILPSTVQIYSQKFSRPTSARQVSRKASPGKTRPGSAGTFKDPDAPSPQGSANQRAIVCALQKLAEKQATRQYATSSHISLLTQHLTNLNLANGAFGRGGFTLSPSVRHGTMTHGPVRAVHTDTSAMSRALPDDGTALWDGDGDARGAYSQVTGVSPLQRYQPTSGSYQLQFAIQQLQQQKVQSRQLLDQSRARHQAILAARPAPPAPATAPRPHGPAGAAAGPRVTQPPPQTQAHTRGGSVLAPKPPSSNREGLFRKTATQRLNKPCSSEAHASGAGSSAQHVVYEAVCGKAGLSVYSKLFQSYGSKNR